MEHKRNSFEMQNVKNSAKRDRPFAKRNKQSLAKRGKTSKGFATAIQSTADNFHNLQEALKAKHELRHEELREVSKLREMIRNVESEIKLLEPVTFHDLQEVEKRSLKRDLVMLLSAIAIPAIVELLHFFL